LPNTFIPLPGEVDILLVKGKNQTKVGNYKWKILPAHLHKATIKQNRKTKIGKSESPEKKTATAVRTSFIKCAGSTEPLEHI